MKRSLCDAYQKNAGRALAVMTPGTINGSVDQMPRTGAHKK